MNFNRITKSHIHFKNHIKLFKRYFEAKKNDEKSNELTRKSRTAIEILKDESKVTRKENLFEEFMTKHEFKQLIGTISNCLD
jgi:hypothetical protein